MLDIILLKYAEMDEGERINWKHENAYCGNTK